jgi:hypothetical protein
MQSRLYPRLRRIANGLMVLALGAFLQQGVLIAVSQMVATTGSMPEPAVMLAGPVHLHDNLAGHVHAHGGNSEVGHVHHPGDLGHDDSDVAVGPFWSLATTSAVLPMWTACAVSFDVVGTVERLPDGHLDGIEPDGLTRPPSTPSMG